MSRAVCPQTLLNRKRPRYDGRSRNRILLFVVTWKGRCGRHRAMDSGAHPARVQTDKKRKNRVNDKAAVVVQQYRTFYVVFLQRTCIGGGPLHQWA